MKVRIFALLNLTLHKKEGTQVPSFYTHDYKEISN